MEGVTLTKEDYADARDAFAKVVRSIDELFTWFALSYVMPDEDEDYADFLDRIGYYMTGDEHHEVKYAKRIFETLAGRNAARAL